MIFSRTPQFQSYPYSKTQIPLTIKTNSTSQRKPLVQTPFKMTKEQGPEHITTLSMSAFNLGTTHQSTQPTSLHTCSLVLDIDKLDSYLIVRLKERYKAFYHECVSKKIQNFQLDSYQEYPSHSTHYEEEKQLNSSITEAVMLAEFIAYNLRIESLMNGKIIPRDTYDYYIATEELRLQKPENPTMIIPKEYLFYEKNHLMGETVLESSNGHPKSSSAVRFNEKVSICFYPTNPLILTQISKKNFSVRRISTPSANKSSRRALKNIKTYGKPLKISDFCFNWFNLVEQTKSENILSDTKKPSHGILKI